MALREPAEGQAPCVGESSGKLTQQSQNAVKLLLEGAQTFTACGFKGLTLMMVYTCISRLFPSSDCWDLLEATLPSRCSDPVPALPMPFFSHRQGRDGGEWFLEAALQDSWKSAWVPWLAPRPAVGKL